MIRLVVITLAISGALGNYSCICNYNAKLDVFKTNSDTGQPLGQMYEFDCKPQLQNALDGWSAIAFQKQLAYVKQGPNVQVQSCPGDPPVEDLLTTHEAENTTDVEWNSTTSFASLHTTLQAVTTSSTGPAVNSTANIQATTDTDATAKASTLQPITSTAALSSTLSTGTASTTTAPLALASSTVHTSMLSLSSSPISSSPLVSSTSTPSHNSTVLGGTSHCSAYIMSSPRGAVTQHGTSCYEFITYPSTWPHAESLCKKAGGHLVHISNESEQDFILKFLRSHHYQDPVWIGLHDRNREERFEWISGASVTYVNWVTGRKDSIFHGDEDCVYMDPSLLVHGKWDDVPCGDNPFGGILFGNDKYAFICQYSADYPVQHTQTTVIASLQTDGDIQLCPHSVQQSVSHTSGFLAQFEGSCYALFTEKQIWEHGESRCKAHNGHLAYIINAQQQSFIEGFMHRHNPNNAVWIGLHDTIREGHFEWTSGEPVHYTNWVSGHGTSTSAEDCVALIPNQNGKWDDILCGSGGFFGTSERGETHYVLCQYRITIGPSVIG